jgi:activator of HSP90 ATPase
VEEFSMTPTIQYSATFEKATPAKLYELFADSAKHTAATGMPAKISRKVGGNWTAFGKMLLGKNLALIPNRMIVQAWRSSEWKKSDPDSILVVSFEKVEGGAKVDLVHVGVPEYDHAGVTQGWIKYYWEPWKAYLSSKAAKKRS